MKGVKPHKSQLLYSLNTSLKKQMLLYPSIVKVKKTAYWLMQPTR